MNSTKSFFFIVFSLAASVIQTKSPVVQSDIFSAIASGKQKFVKVALQTPSAITSRNAIGQSVLHVAVAQKNSFLMLTLIKAGAQVNALDAFGKTALDYAVEMKCNKVIYFLVKYGARVTSEANAIRLKNIYKSRAVKFVVTGLFFTPFLWIGTLTSMSHVSDVMVLTV